MVRVMVSSGRAMVGYKCYWAALSLSFRLISILMLVNIIAWGPQVIYFEIVFKESLDFEAPLTPCQLTSLNAMILDIYTPDMFC